MKSSFAACSSAVTSGETDRDSEDLMASDARRRGRGEDARALGKWAGSGVVAKGM
jgi:hypothetical protein